ncbi:MAG: carbohydrate ABC transporter permease [Clostridia bacterium]|nr:carbohydrate ABC transporter permease [Clostridia bacterium]
MNKTIAKGIKKFFSLNSLIFFVLILYVAIFWVLVAWGVLTSFKSYEDFRVNIFGLPKQWMWNYNFIFKMFKVKVTNVDGSMNDVGVFTMTWNSVLYSVGCSLASAFMPMLVGYMCARYKNKYSKITVSVIIVVMQLPLMSGQLATLKLLRQLHIYDSIGGMILLKAHPISFYFLIFLAMFEGIPKEYEEAAKIDGAGNWKIMLSIIFPMAWSTFFTVFTLSIQIGHRHKRISSFPLKSI